MQAYKATPFMAKTRRNYMGFSSFPRPTQTLKRGMKNDQVKWLQAGLNATVPGTKLEYDGSFGPLTEEKVKEFQKRFHLTVDGHFGPLSLAAMRQRVDPE
jgi:peptidoglycan hydrolase-like protein with peptidoglycan-binding domain